MTKLYEKRLKADQRKVYTTYDVIDPETKPTYWRLGRMQMETLSARKKIMFTENKYLPLKTVRVVKKLY